MVKENNTEVELVLVSNLSSSDLIVQISQCNSSNQTAKGKCLIIHHYIKESILDVILVYMFIVACM